MMFVLKEVLDKATIPLFVLRGRRPWSFGYYTAKKNAISRSIDQGLFLSGKKLPIGYGRKVDERVIEYPWVFSQLSGNPGKVLDAGSALNHSFLLQRPPLRDSELTIMTLAPEKRCFWNRSISYVYGDLRERYFADEIFDVVISVSTIEHIGLDNTMLYTDVKTKCESDPHGFVPAVLEFRRVLKKGGVCLITVPFGRPGVHRWYQIFDAALVKKVIEVFNPAEFHIDYFGYEENGWKCAEAGDLVGAEFFDIHDSNSFDTDFAAGARGVACIRLVA